MSSSSSERLLILRTNEGAKCLAKRNQKVVGNDKGESPCDVWIIFGIPKGTFDVVVKKVELLARKGNTRIPDPIDVALKSVAIHHWGFSLSIEHHVNTGGFPLRDEGSIPDKTVVFPQFGNETLRSHVNVFHKPS